MAMQVSKHLENEIKSKLQFANTKLIDTHKKIVFICELASYAARSEYLTRVEQINVIEAGELRKLQQEYDTYFLDKLDRFGAASVTELNDKQKKEFYSQIQQDWTDPNHNLQKAEYPSGAIPSTTSMSSSGEGDDEKEKIKQLYKDVEEALSRLRTYVYSGGNILDDTEFKILLEYIGDPSMPARWRDVDRKQRGLGWTAFCGVGKNSDWEHAQALLNMAASGEKDNEVLNQFFRECKANKDFLEHTLCIAAPDEETKSLYTYADNISILYNGLKVLIPFNRQAESMAKIKYILTNAGAYLND